MNLEKIVSFLLAQLYTRFAFAYDLVAGLVSNWRWKRWVTSILDEINGPSVLELGHGPGHLQLALHRKGLSVFGVDSSKTMGRLSRDRLAAHAFSNLLARSRAQALPFPDGYFQQVISTFPTSYISDLRTVQEVQRVLSPEGCILILTAAQIAGTSLYDKIARWLFQVTKQDVFSDDLTADILKSVGFQVDCHRIQVGNSVVIVIRATKPG